MGILSSRRVEVLATERGYPPAGLCMPDTVTATPIKKGSERLLIESILAFHFIVAPLRIAGLASDSKNGHGK